MGLDCIRRWLPTDYRECFVHIFSSVRQRIRSVHPKRDEPTSRLKCSDNLLLKRIGSHRVFTFTTEMSQKKQQVVQVNVLFRLVMDRVKAILFSILRV